MGLLKPNVEKMKAKKDIKGLARALRKSTGDHEDPNRWLLRRSAASALREIATSAPDEIRAANVEKMFVKELKNEDRIVRKAVAEVFDKLGWKPSNDVERIHYLIAKGKWGELAEIGKPAVEPLISCLVDERVVDVQVNVAQTLGEIRDVMAIQPLLHLFSPGYIDHIRNYYSDTLVPVVVEALVSIGQPAVDQLIKVLKDMYTRESVGIPAVWALCEIGDRKAIEAVLFWIFKEGELGPELGTTISLPDFIRRVVPPTVLPKLFGEYTDLILDIFAWKVTLYDEQYDVSRCVEAIQRLCMIKTPVSNNILHKVAQITKVNVGSYYSRSEFVMNSIDFKLEGQMAKEELKRRGKPRYDSSIFLSKEAWEFLGVEPTAPLERDRVIIDKHRDETAKRKTVEEHDRVIMDKYRENTKIMEYTKDHHLNKIEEINAREALGFLLQELEAKSSVTIKYFHGNIAVTKDEIKWLHIVAQPSNIVIVVYGIFSRNRLKPFNEDNLKEFEKIPINARLESYGINLKVEKLSQIEDLLKVIE